MADEKSTTVSDSIEEQMQKSKDAVDRAFELAAQAVTICGATVKQQSDMFMEDIRIINDMMNQNNQKAADFGNIITKGMTDLAQGQAAIIERYQQLLLKRQTNTQIK